MVGEAIKKGINGLIKAVIIVVVIVGVAMFLIGKYLF